MEMLIVVAIIAVLVAVAIPTFSSQLHKARVATDWANVRSYYAQLQYEFMETGEINEAYLHELGKPGLIWIAECPNGYNILYYCNEKHNGCQLVL